MRRQFLIVALSVFPASNFVATAQSLKNTSWVRITSERKDGSRIVERGPAHYIVRRLVFDEHTAGFASLNVSPKSQVRYRVENSRLFLGMGAEYSIDFHNDTILAISYIPLQPLPQEQAVREFYINEKLYASYVFEKNLVPVKGDTILANPWLYPWRPDIDGFLSEAYGVVLRKGNLDGTIVITPAGEVSSVKITRNDNMSDKTEAKIKLMLEASGHWHLPGQTDKYFKCGFKVHFIANRFYTGMQFYLTSDSLLKAPRLLKVAEFKDSRAAFEKGLRQLKRGNLESAMLEFSKCTVIDSLYLDAYYNKAFVYDKVGRPKQACENWKILKDLGQKQAEAIFESKCQ